MLFYKLKDKLNKSQHKRYHSADFSKPFMDPERVKQLTNEVCKLRNEAIQVPILKAKLDILEHELRTEKEKYKSPVFLDEIESKKFENSTLMSLAKAEEDPIVLAVPPRSHKRNTSSFSAYSGQSLFSVQNSENDLVRSNTELDLQLTYEETNKSLLEKLKIQEMQNIKLYNQITQLQQRIGKMSKAIEEGGLPHNASSISLDPASADNTSTCHNRSVSTSMSQQLAAPRHLRSKSGLTINVAPEKNDKGNGSFTILENTNSDEDDNVANSVFSLNINFDNLVDKKATDATEDLLSASSPFTSTSSTASSSMEKCHNYSFPPITPDTPDFSTFQSETPKQRKTISCIEDVPLSNEPANLHRNEHFYKTLRRKNSNESLLSMNKSKDVSGKFSKSQYYVIRDEAKDFNMSSSSSTTNSYNNNKRHSLVSYCQNQMHKVSPRPKSTHFF